MTEIEITLEDVLARLDDLRTLLLDPDAPEWVVETAREHIVELTNRMYTEAYR